MRDYAVERCVGTYGHIFIPGGKKHEGCMKISKILPHCTTTLNAVCIAILCASAGDDESSGQM